SLLNLNFNNVVQLGGVFDQWAGPAQIDLTGNPLTCYELELARQNTAISIRFDGECGNGDYQKEVVFTSLITQLNSDTGGDQVNPSIASLPDDRFVVLWTDNSGKDGFGGGIFGRIYSSTFEALSPEFLANSITGGHQTGQNVASAPNGNFMATWGMGHGQVDGQIFNASGETIGVELVVMT
ncbi:MAG: hypothetical protein VW684_15875, partial [Betaproteobacteria bacterium]